MPSSSSEKSTTRSASKRPARKGGVRPATRKAPTKPSPSPKRPDRSRLAFILALVFAALVITGTSLAIGMSDEGEIDIASAIQERADELERQGDMEGSARTRGVTAPSPQSDLPNGGLIGRGNKQTAEQRGRASTPATENEESEDENATSTDEASKESELEGEDGDEADEDQSEVSEGTGGESEASEEVAPTETPEEQSTAQPEEAVEE